MYNKKRDDENQQKNIDDGLLILDIQEQDRQRIARDLHDSSLQNLTHLIHKLELCRLCIDTDPIKAKLELALTKKVLKQTIEEIRVTIFNLRPMTFDDLGFKVTLENLIYSVNENHEYIIETDIDELLCENNIILVSIYRNIQELMNNIIKHANAKKIIIKCKKENDFCIVDIVDDGIGFDIENYNKENHFGLSLIKERVNLLNGKIEIYSKINTGTNVHFEIPI